MIKVTRWHLSKVSATVAYSEHNAAFVDSLFRWRKCWLRFVL